VQKAGLQPTNGQNPNQIAMDEIVNRIDTKQYWLYAAVAPTTNHEPETAETWLQAFAV
jgi:transposase-like protein